MHTTDLHFEEMGVYDVDGISDGTPDVEFDGGHGSNGEIFLLSQIHHRVVVPVPFSICWSEIIVK